MRILHVNDVARVSTILVAASAGRDGLYQPTLRRDVGEGWVATARLAVRRARDVARLRREFHAGGYTHLHVHYATFAHLAELGGLSFSLHLHGGDVLGDIVRGFKGLLVRRAMQHARRVVVSTPDLVTRARRYRPDAEYVPNPVERGDRRTPRRAHDEPHVMLLSKMDYLKGWDRQVQLMMELRSRWPAMVFEFIADGQLPPATKQNLSGRLVALGGSPLPLLARDDYRARIAQADFAIGQMEVGALGMSELEALALGVVTVADTSASASLGVRPPTVDPSTAAVDLAALWSGGVAARTAWAARAEEYLRAHHDPPVCLRLLETQLTDSGVGRGR